MVEPAPAMDGLSALTLAEPRWLLLLIAAAPLLWLAPRMRSADDAMPLRRVRTSAKLLALAFVCLALARPTWREARRDVEVIAVVDASDSVADAALEDARRAVASLVETARRSSVRTRIVRFADEAAELTTAAPPRAAPLTIDRPAAPGGLKTDIGQALGLALGLFEPGTLPRVLLLSDGRETEGDALAAGARAAARGVRVFFRAQPSAVTADVAVLKLDGPEVVRPRAAFDLEATFLATVPARARVRLHRPGRPPAGDAERVVELRPGPNRVRWTTRLEGAEPSLYRVEIVESTANAHRDNDRALTVIVPEPRPRVLLVDARGGAASFAQALAANEMEVERGGPAALAPRADGAPALAAVDLVVLSDVAPSSLSEAQAQALETFVRGGGGLLVAGGPSSFGSERGRGARLEALLPVREDLTSEQHEATLALGLVIDRSGSMSGPKMELTKEAARGAAELLGPQDLITVVVFDSQPHTVVRMQAASNRQRILGDIAQIRASGGTNILPGLREAIEQLLAARARKKHVILLSDGQSPADGVQELVDEAAAARVTVSTVAVGDGADLALLQTIAGRGGGRFYHARDPSTIPRIFTRETAEMVRSTVVERPTPLLPGKRAEALAGIAWASAPPLAGFVRTRARRDAEILLEAPGGEPLLCRWQVGVGRVAAWTSDLGGRYGAQLARWPAFPKLWAQVARSLMRRQAANRLPLRLVESGPRVLARLDARAEDGRPLGGLGGELEVVEIGAEVEALGTLPPPRHRVPLVERSAGAYEAEIDRGSAAVLLAKARLWPAANSRSAPPVADGQARLSVPLAPERLPVAPDEASRPGARSPVPQGRALLAALAARTGGREVRDDLRPLLDAGPDRVMSERSLRGAFVVVALALFLAEVALRRAKFRRPGGGAAAPARSLASDRAA
jgi:Mg-chelatase subunit ChlD